jgi:hypothetical protein
VRRLASGVALLLLITACGDSASTTTTEPATSSTVSTTTTSTTEAPTTTADAEAANIQIARDSMAAWNTGDVDAYLGFFADDARFLLWPAHEDHVRNGLEFYMALGDETLIDECQAWQDGRIRCHAIGRNDLSGPVGITAESDWSFWITDGLISKTTAAEYDSAGYWFIMKMGWWLEAAHPEVWESTFATSETCLRDDTYDCWETWRATPETAAALLEYAPEFIAQSDEFSITE